MLTIRQVQIDALVRGRRSTFVEGLAEELSRADQGGTPAQAEKVAWRARADAMLDFCLLHELGDARSATAFMRTIVGYGLKGPEDLPPLALEVLSARAVEPALKLRMLEEVLAAAAPES